MTAPLIRPFDGYVPRADLIEAVVAPPVSSITTDRYEQLVADNPDSILHLLGSAIDTGEGGSDPALYDQLGATRLQSMVDEGILVHSAVPTFYILSIGMAETAHVGIVCEIDMSGVADGRVRRHEHTRSETESLVLRHLDIVNAHTDPVTMTYRERPELGAAIAAIISNRDPIRQFTADDGSEQRLWAVSDAATVQLLELLVSAVPAVYIADGHHRTTAAARLRRRRAADNDAHTGLEPYNYLLTVLFAEDALQLHGYNRAVTDLAGMTSAQFIRRIGDVADIEEVYVTYAEEARPLSSGGVAMILDGSWYRIIFRAEDIPDDPKGALDAVLLQELILGPILEITDVRADSRLRYIPGPAGLAELEHHDAAVGFALQGASVADVMAIADLGEVMPPKSTWFSPKVRTGLVIRRL